MQNKHHQDDLNIKLLNCFHRYDATSIEYLLKLGADANLRNDGDDEPILSLSLRLSKNSIVELLLKHGANPNACARPGYPAGKNCYISEPPPIFVAIRSRNLATFKLLLHYGANIDVTDSDGKTALMYTIIYNQPEMMRILLDFGSNPLLSVSQKSYTGRVVSFTAFDCVTILSDNVMLELLVNYAAEHIRKQISHQYMWRQPYEFAQDYDCYRITGGSYHAAAQAMVQERIAELCNLETVPSSGELLAWARLLKIDFNQHTTRQHLYEALKSAL